MASVTGKVHPLVILNISDHHTRSKFSNQTQVIGALMGVQTERTIQINNTFEIPLLGMYIQQGHKIDSEFFTKKQEQYKQVFPELDFIGWYSTEALDIAIHHQV
jgi:COP9 signalosome complex subunit 6